MGPRTEAKTSKNRTFFNRGRPPEGSDVARITHNKKQLTLKSLGGMQNSKSNTKSNNNNKKKFNNSYLIEDDLKGNGSACTLTRKEIRSARAKGAPRRPRPRERSPAGPRSRRCSCEVPGTSHYCNGAMAKAKSQSRLRQGGQRQETRDPAKLRLQSGLYPPSSTNISIGKVAGSPGPPRLQRTSCECPAKVLYPYAYDMAETPASPRTRQALCGNHMSIPKLTFKQMPYDGADINTLAVHTTRVNHINSYCIVRKYTIKYKAGHSGLVYLMNAHTRSPDAIIDDTTIPMYTWKNTSQCIKHITNTNRPTTIHPVNATSEKDTRIYGRCSSIKEKPIEAKPARVEGKHTKQVTIKETKYKFDNLHITSHNIQYTSHNQCDEIHICI